MAYIDELELYKRAYKRACQDLADDCCRNCANSKQRGLYESGEEIEKNILKLVEREKKGGAVGINDKH